MKIEVGDIVEVLDWETVRHTRSAVDSMESMCGKTYEVRGIQKIDVVFYCLFDVDTSKTWWFAENAVKIPEYADINITAEELFELFI